MQPELPVELGHRVLEACAAPMIVFEHAPGGCVVRYVNPAFARRTGYSAAEIRQVGWDGLHLDGAGARGSVRPCDALTGKRELEMPLRIYGKDGVTFSATLQLSAVEASAAHRTTYIVGVLREHAADAAYLSSLGRDAHCDPLTGLPNRRLLGQRAQQAIAQALRDGRSLGVAIVDLDGFRHVNDEFGHAAGDDVLCTVAARLGRDLRPRDFVARVGGHEFVLLVSDVNGEFSLCSAVDRLRHRVEQPIHLYGQPVIVACSVGVAVLPDHGDNLAALLQHADRARYRRKALHHAAHAPGSQTRAAGPQPLPGELAHPASESTDRH